MTPVGHLISLGRMALPIRSSTTVILFRNPLNCERGSPLLKNELAVPSGPTKLNVPLGSLLAAAWKFKVVFAGTEPPQDSVPHSGLPVGDGFASLADDMKI